MEQFGFCLSGVTGSVVQARSDWNGSKSYWALNCNVVIPGD